MNLPNNSFGRFVMGVVVLLILIVPFVVVMYALSSTPLWVRIPVSLAASVASFLALVRFRP